MMASMTYKSAGACDKTNSEEWFKILMEGCDYKNYSQDGRTMPQDDEITPKDDVVCCWQWYSNQLERKQNQCGRT